MTASDRALMSPCPIRGRLTGIKRGIFNPDLPTLRCMERHDVMCKLPEEHCRHTTRCTARQFAQANHRPFTLPDRDFPCLATVTGRGITSHYNTLEDLQEHHAKWAAFLAENKSLALRDNFKANLDKLHDKLGIDDWHFDGVALKVIKPEIRDWRYTFKCEPGLDQSGKAQRVTPSDITTRHRTLDHKYDYCQGVACTKRFR